jgi:hypothetical protein
MIALLCLSVVFAKDIKISELINLGVAYGDKYKSGSFALCFYLGDAYIKSLTSNLDMDLTIEAGYLLNNEFFSFMGGRFFSLYKRNIEFGFYMHKFDNGHKYVFYPWVGSTILRNNHPIYFRGHILPGGYLFVASTPIF